MNNKYFLIYIFLLIIFSCTNNKEPISSITEIEEGKILVDGTILYAPGAEIIINGKKYNEKAHIPLRKICAVLLNDSVYFIYNEGKDTVLTLSQHESKIAILKKIIQYYSPSIEMKKKLFLKKSIAIHNEYELLTGIKIKKINGNIYEFENYKNRTTAIEIDSIVRFLMPKGVLPHISDLLFNIYSQNFNENKVIIDIGDSKIIKSYGAISRLSFFPPLYFIYFQEDFRESLFDRVRNNLELCVKVDVVDAILVISDLIYDIIGAKFDECVNLALTGLVESLKITFTTFMTAFDTLALRNNIKDIIDNTITNFITCLINKGICVSATTGLCLIINKLFNYVELIWEIPELLIGAYDSATSFPYSELDLNSPVFYKSIKYQYFYDNCEGPQDWYLPSYSPTIGWSNLYKLPWQKYVSDNYGDAFFIIRFNLLDTTNIKIKIQSDDGSEIYINGSYFGWIDGVTCHQEGCINMAGMGCGINHQAGPLVNLSSYLNIGENVLSVHVSNGRPTRMYFNVLIYK